MRYTHKNKGTCSSEVSFEIENGKVINVKFERGCSGNTSGVAALIEGMDVHEAIGRLSGIRCGMKETSCPDQLARGLKEALEQQ